MEGGEGYVKCQQKMSGVTIYLITVVRLGQRREIEREGVPSMCCTLTMDIDAQDFRSARDEMR